MKIIILLTLLVSVCFCSVAQTDSVKCNSNYFTDTLLDKLVGNWNLTGKVGKRNVKNHFSAQWILNHQFLELNFTDTANPPQYIARVSIGYDCEKRKYVMHWLDNFGGAYSETLGYGNRQGQSIIFTFNYPDGLFQNEISYDNNTWHFHLSSKKDDKWVTFAEEYLKRN